MVIVDSTTLTENVANPVSQLLHHSPSLKCAGKEESLPTYLKVSQHSTLVVRVRDVAKIFGTNFIRKLHAEQMFFIIEQFVA